MKLLKPFVLLSLFTSAVFSQVIIREKVELVPKPSAVAVAGQLEVTLSLSGSLNPNRPAFVRASNFGCGIDAIGGTSVSAPLQAGLYQIVGRFSTAGVVNYELRVKVGNDELLVEQGVAPANATINLVPQVGFSSGINFSFGGPIVQGETAGYGFIGFVSIPCSTPAVHPLLSTTLSITTGQGLGEFVDETGRLLGESVTRKLNELGGIRFIANGRSPVGSQEEVGIQATMGGGVAGTASLVVIKKQADCSDAPPCSVSDIPPPPSFTVVPRPNGFNNHSLASCQENFNALGGFIPIVENDNISIQPFNVDICLDKQNGHWRARVTQPIEVNTLLDICYNNIRTGVKLVSGVNEVDQFDKCSVAKRDFNGHYSYPIRYEKYLLRDVLLMHEDMHRRDFQEKLLDVLPQLITPFSALQSYTCDDLPNLETAKKNAEEKIQKLVKNFLRKAANNYAENMKSEQTIHQLEPIKVLIKNFIESLNCQN